MITCIATLTQSVCIVLFWKESKYISQCNTSTHGILSIATRGRLLA